MQKIAAPLEHEVEEREHHVANPPGELKTDATRVLAPFSALQLVEGAEAGAKHKPTGLTKLADQAGTVRRVRARAGRLAGLGAAK